MFVPCDSAKISICDSIFARIGAADSIQKNLSTFAMEMVIYFYFKCPRLRKKILTFFLQFS